MSHFRLIGALRWLADKPDLHRRIAVASKRLFLQHRAGAGLYNSNRYTLSVSREDLAHSNFFSQQSVDHFCDLNKYKTDSDLKLDLNIHASGQIKLHQSINCLLGRLHDIQKALMRPDLKLLTAFFINVRTTQNTILVNHRRQGDRTYQPRSGTLGCIDDLSNGLIE